MQQLLITLLGRLLIPPLLPPMQLPIAARALPPVKQAIETVCISFFWVGVSQAAPIFFTLGLVAGVLATLVYFAIRAVCRALVRVLNVELTRLEQPREPLP